MFKAVVPYSTVFLLLGLKSSYVSVSVCVRVCVCVYVRVCACVYVGMHAATLFVNNLHRYSLSDSFCWYFTRMYAAKIPAYF